MTVTVLREKIISGGIDALLASSLAVSAENIPAARERLALACDEFAALYGKDRQAELFSVGGRTEVSGNHTDHNCGRVLCAAINLDIIAVASPRDDGVVNVKSEGFPADCVLPSAAEKPDEQKFFTSASIIAGMERAFLDRSLSVGGFDAYTTSNVFKGSGLSSSAAFEVMIGNILNYLYNDGGVSNVEIAKMAQFSENRFFGKPCGLMDQTACAVGGFIAIDFGDTANPVIEKMDFDLGGAGYKLCIVDTGGNHADLNGDYASIPREMKEVAAHFGKNVLRETSREEVIADIPALRLDCGDRPILRALHFFDENDRVAAQTAALCDGDISAFLEGVRASGLSSFRYLQNVFTVKNVMEQGLSLALCLTEQFLGGTGAAWRVHGGGFAGTIQAFVPQNEAEGYKQKIEAVFGDGSCHILSVRPAGAVRLL